MKLVVDTNVLLSALIRNSTSRSIILNPEHDFYVPEFALQEVEKYSDIISSKSGLPKKEIELLFDILKVKLEVVPLEDFRESFGKAEVAVGHVDEKDVPFLALALNIECDGIWSNDAHLKEQKLVDVWNTIQLVRVLRI